MKLRVKLGRDSRLINLEAREAAGTATLEDLKQAVASQFNIDGQEFFLSLNKSDALGTDNETLSDLGIVAGDLIYVVGPDVSEASVSQTKTQPLTSNSTMSVDSSTSREAVQNGAHHNPVSENKSKNTDEMDTAEKTDVCVDDLNTAKELSEVNRYLREPLVVRESTGDQVPILLKQLFVSASCTSPSDALWVVLHTLMLESGFSPHERVESTKMPSDWRRPGFYTCEYSLSGSTQNMGTCKLAGVGIGSSTVVHGLYSRENETFKTEQIQLKASDYVRVISAEAAATYRSLDRLSRHFKDTVCLPLFNAILAGADHPMRQGLEGLPYEIKMRILSLLDVKSLCRLGQTCQDLNQMHRDKMLWRRRFIQDYGKPGDNNLERNWFELYKETWKKKRQEEAERRRLHHLIDTDPFFGLPHHGPFRPSPGLPFPPRLIGGDYDLNPEFAAGGIPMGGPGRRPVGQVPPDLGMPSPLGGGRSGLDLFGGRRGRGNMTGSPFSSPFRGGPFM